MLPSRFRSPPSQPRSFLRFALRLLWALATLLLVGSIGVYWSSQSRIGRLYDVVPDRLFAEPDSVSIDRGRHVATIRGCVECHGANLGGRVFLDDPMIGRFVAGNLTAGRGGIGARYSEADWIRAIRHGVRPSGRGLLVMPSDEYYHLSDADLASLVEYLKGVPAVNNELPASHVSPVGRALITIDREIAILPAERIDHVGPRPVAPAVGASIEYGRYLATSCIGCHGAGLAGGRIPGVPPDWPAASNLTPLAGTALARWSQAEFVRALRSGATPEGRKLDQRYMPWQVLGQMTDDEMQALWMYLRSLPGKPTGTR